MAWAVTNSDWLSIHLFLFLAFNEREVSEWVWVSEWLSKRESDFSFIIDCNRKTAPWKEPNPRLFVVVVVMPNPSPPKKKERKKERKIEN